MTDQDFDFPQELTLTEYGQKLMLNKKEDREKIVVIGIGGAGNNAIEYLYNNKVYMDNIAEGVTHYIFNTDEDCLESKQCTNRPCLGRNLLKGKGAGSIIQRGEDAANESIKEIKDIVANADLVFVTAGMGGGTGTLGAKVVAQAAKEAEAIVVSLVSLPFKYENRYKEASFGTRELYKYSDSLIVVDNQRIIDNYPTHSFSDGLNEANTILSNAISGIIRIIQNTSHINSDFEDLKTVLQNGGRSQIIHKDLFEDDLEEFLKQPDQYVDQIYKKVIDSPIIAKTDIRDAKAILFSIEATDHFTQKMIDLLAQKFSNPNNIQSNIDADSILDSLDGDFDDFMSSQAELELPKFIFGYDLIASDAVDTSATRFDEEGNLVDANRPRMSITIVATGMSKDKKAQAIKAEAKPNLAYATQRDSAFVKELAIAPSYQATPTARGVVNDEPHQRQVTHTEVRSQSQTNVTPAEVTPAQNNTAMFADAQMRALLENLSEDKQLELLMRLQEMKSSQTSASVNQVSRNQAEPEKKVSFNINKDEIAYDE